MKGEKSNRVSPDNAICMFETHIEQGPILEDAGNEIGVVDCVLGMFNYRIRFYGQTTHAGTFPMEKRKDALWAASKAICYLHESIDALNIPDLVYTIHVYIHVCPIMLIFHWMLDMKMQNS